ncbi:MAG: thiolase family protein [Glaciihabitans sp.]|nr:thiolase family protein [Glaciihabitans sp.]
MPTAVLVDAVRTASGRGKPGGRLSDTHPVDLLAGVLRALVDRNQLDPGVIDDVIGGCVSQVGGQSANVTRNAVLAAGFPETIPATTVDRQCGSSQQAATFAAQGVVAGAYDIVIACGVEVMSREPLGSAAIGKDPWGTGIAARYPAGLVGQGISAELVASHWNLSRHELDEFSARSHRLAAAADFSREIVAVDGHPGSAAEVDETIRPGTTAEALSQLHPAFYDEALARRFPQIEWRITAGNSSPLTDGASAVLIMSEDAAEALGLTPRARFVASAVVGSDPIEMLTGVIPVTRRILSRSGLTIDDMDTYEVNEAFAPVPLAWAREVGADAAKLNPRGGAIALGHALGSSGTRLMATMLGTLEQGGGRYGLQVMCEGAGMANATILERL